MRLAVLQARWRLNGEAVQTIVAKETGYVRAQPVGRHCSQQRTAIIDAHGDWSIEPVLVSRPAVDLIAVCEVQIADVGGK